MHTKHFHGLTKFNLPDEYNLSDIVGKKVEIEIKENEICIGIIENVRIIKTEGEVDEILLKISGIEDYIETEKVVSISII